MGKKAKARRRQSLPWFAISTTSFVVLISLIALYFAPRKTVSNQIQPATTVIEPWLNHLVETSKSALNEARNRLPDKWLLDPETDRRIKEQVARQFRERADQALDLYIGDGHVRKLHALFADKLVPAIYGDPIQARYPEIWMMPYPSRASQPYLIHFNESYGMVLFAAFDWSKIWFESQIMHELMHGEYKLENKPSATAPADSDLWGIEEVEAGEFQRHILDLATKGAYTQTALQIVESKMAADLQGFMGSLNPEDLRRLDDTLPPAFDVKEETARLPYAITSLGFIWVESKKPASEMNSKLEVFKIFRRAREIVVRGY